ncbi:putative reverse transcriptase domain-containing protein [Tanacetum coccineum]|uniref:Reverse transcriptase domain-containing protein n=1 Tax=Tanacetum coccineum TaxID=301880 RepID=A0ABQ4WW63_9ASTR
MVKMVCSVIRKLLTRHMVNGYQSLLYVTPLNKHAFQKKTDVPKTEKNHVVSKPVTLQTLPTKQTGANQNTNVLRQGMYRVVTTQESQTNKTKSALSSTGMNATSRVRRPMSIDSHVAHSILDNSKKAAKNVAVYVRKNKQTDNTSINGISNKENVIDVDVVNTSKAKTFLCISCMQNVLIPCHDKCLAKRKLNVRSNVRRTFFTISRTLKSSETTFVAPKTRFSDKETQSKTLDTTYVVCKSKIDVESDSKAKDKISSGRESNLYTISISDMAASSPVCLMSKATSTKSWLWYRRLSHLNFGTINDLTRLDLVDGLPKFKYGNDHLCSSCERGKNKKASHLPKLVPTKVCKIRTDNGTEFKNTSLKAHYEKLGIMQQFSIARTPQQNGVVERRNHTLVEMRTMHDVKMIVKAHQGGVAISSGKLVSWSSKENNCTAMSTAKSLNMFCLSACEFTSNLGIRTQLLDYGYKYNRFRCTVTPRVPLLFHAIPRIQHSKTSP